MAAADVTGPSDEIAVWVLRIASALLGSGILVAVLVARAARAEARTQAALRRAELAEADVSRLRDEAAARLGERRLLHGHRPERGSDPSREPSRDPVRPSGAGLTGSRLARLRATLRDRRRR